MVDKANNLSQHFYIETISGYVGKQKDITYVTDTMEPSPFQTIINGYAMNNILIN